MKRVYLAHSVSQRKEGKIWQERIESMGFEVINPFYPLKPRKDIEDLDKGLDVPWNVKSPAMGRAIVHSDIALVDSCDLIVAILPDGPTIGIPCEMFYAMEWHKPVLTVAPPKYQGHPWILGMSTQVFKTFDDLRSALTFWR
jgi:nucleoside 2-deoxyribosyltransferase